MPLALDPFETFEVSLRTDEEKPEAERPTFRFRYMSLRDWRKGSALTTDKETLRKDTSGEKLIGEVLMAIRETLVDWRVNDRNGQPIPYDPEALDTILIVGEIWELFYQARRQSRLSVPEKKESESPSPTSTEPSAETADPVTATTDPQ